MSKMIALGEVPGETQGFFDVGFPPDENGVLIGFAGDEGKEGTPVYNYRLVAGEHVFEFDPL